jgi:hypothetical protein
MALCDHLEWIDNLVNNLGRWTHYMLIIIGTKNIKQQDFPKSHE